MSQEQDNSAEINKAINQAIQMAFTGKAISSSRLSPYAEKYYQAIMWGDTKGFSSSEARLIEQLHNEVQGGYTERAVPKSVQEQMQQFAMSGESKGKIYVPEIVKPVTKELNVPSGYATKEVSNIYAKYQNKLTDKQRQQLTQWEQANIITNNPEFQKEIRKIYETPESREKQKVFAKNFGYSDWEQYGEYNLTPLSISEREQLSEQAESIREQSVYSKIKKGIGTVQDVVSRISSLGLSEKPQRDIYKPEYYAPQGYTRSTMQTQPISNLRADEIYQKESDNLQFEFNLKSEKLNEALNQKYQNLLDSGQISYEEAIQQSELEFNSESQKLQEEFDSRVNTLTSDYERGALEESVVPNLVSGAVTGALAGISAPISIGLGILGGASLLFNWEETKESFTKYPKESITSFGAGAIGSLIGFRAGTGLKSALRTPKIQSEIAGFSQAQQQGEVVTDLLFKTKVDKQTYYGASKSVSKLLGVQDGVSISETITAGVYKSSKGYKTQDFISGSIGLGKEAELILQSGKTKLTIPKLKTDLGVTVGIIKGKKVDYFTGLGISSRVQGGTISKVSGATALVRGGKFLNKGGYTGFIKELPPIDITDFGSMIGKSGIKSSPTFLKQIYSQSISQSIAPILKDISTTPKVSPISFITPSIATITTQKETPKINFVQELNIIPREKNTQEEKLTSLIAPTQKEKTKQKTSVMEVSILAVSPINRIVSIAAISPFNIQSTRTKLSSKTSQQKTSQQKTMPSQIPTIPFFSISIFPSEEDSFRKEQAYIGLYKQKNRWITGTKPSTKQGALDEISRIVDTNLSRQFKVVPFRKKIKGKEKNIFMESNKLNIGDGYFSDNRYKFRSFAQKKGQKVGLQNQYIEKTKYALEDKEQPKIQQAKIRSLMFSVPTKKNKRKMFRI